MTFKEVQQLHGTLKSNSTVALEKERPRDSVVTWQR